MCAQDGMRNQVNINPGSHYVINAGGLVKLSDMITTKTAAGKAAHVHPSTNKVTETMKTDGRGVKFKMCKPQETLQRHEEDGSDQSLLSFQPSVFLKYSSKPQHFKHPSVLHCCVTFWPAA